ncbi:MAG: hypothetical protein VYA55_14985 [Pseudomonadota bacterium]|nr:hypothetical protein [Pseudomonadota bacterium]
MNKYLCFVPILLASCGGGSGSENNDSPGEDLDPYAGVWVSGCTSSIYANGTLPVDPTSFIETITISESTVSSTFEIYTDADCNDLAEVLTDLAPKYGGALTGVEELTTDNDYPYRRYNTLNPISGESAIEVALIDGVLYRVFLDFAVFESTGEMQHNVIFEWNFTQ